MNFKEKILEMERHFAKESSREAVKNIEDLSLTFISNSRFSSRANTSQRTRTGLLF